MEQLKLAALDKDDLDVLSAHLQDAILTVGDLSYRRDENRFLATLNRFAWEKTTDGRQLFGIPKVPGIVKERRRAALHFDRVTKVQSSKIRQDAKEGVLSLLSLRFSPTEDPSGVIEMVFSGGGTVRLEVECIEAQLADLGTSWATTAIPEHDVEEDRADTGTSQ